MPNSPPPAFASLLRRYRLARGLTQETLAERAGLTREAISLLERGVRQSPRRDTVRSLAEALTLAPDEQACLLTSASRRRRPVRPVSGDPAATQASLPARLTSFIGRERETAEVGELVLGARLVTLTGPGGIGKTSLAWAVAHAVRERFADGVTVVELAVLADEQLVTGTVATALGVHERAGEPILVTLGRALGTSQRLLVLDNGEHVLLPCARLAEALLQTCPNVRILVTSRERLRIGPEVIWRVPALTVPRDDNLPFSELATSEAVQLFAVRAKAVRPDFVLCEANAASLAEICRRLDGIPLAIELAAARVSVLSPMQIAIHVSDRFRLLTTGSRTALPRHQTLRATIDWSYELLSDREQRLFRRLAVFTGGWTLEAASAVCADARHDVLDLLASLVDKSLVLTVEREERARFTMLETIREYAMAHLDTCGEADEIRTRHAAWALTLAETARPVVHTQQKHDAWLRRLDPEFPNLRAALRWLGEACDAERALRLADALWLYWVVHDNHAEGRPQIEAVLGLPGVSAYPATLAALRRGAAVMASNQGDLATARLHNEAALVYYRGQGDRRELGTTLIWLGAVACQQGDFAHALPWLEEGLTLLRGVDNPQELGFALFHLGNACRAMGDLVRARSLLEESVAIFRNAGLTALLTGQSLAYLGVVVEELGDDARADSIYREALTDLSRVDDRLNVASLLESFASLAAKAGQPVRAFRLLGAADRLREEIQSPRTLASSPRHARTWQLAQRQLAPEIADAELAAGRRMTWLEAAAYALAEADEEL